MIRRILIIVLTLLAFTSCEYDEEYVHQNYDIDYRDEMRNWVIMISNIAKQENPDFLIIPQNCPLLFTYSGYADGELCTEFIDSIDGTGQEGISYGYDKYNAAMDNDIKNQFTDLLNIGVCSGLSVLSVNYCDEPEKIDNALDYDNENEYISFVSNSIELIDTQNQSIINENSNDILHLNDARNWLVLLNPEKYETKEEYIDELCATNYDVLVIDAFFYDDVMLNVEDVSRIKIKDNGGQRIVIAYLSIGEAEDYRYYWISEYDDNPPDWILKENSNWAGNYPVEYWNKEWQSIIATGEDSYLKGIIDVGFDGVYLDIVDGYQTFEDMNELDRQ